MAALGSLVQTHLDYGSASAYPGTPSLSEGDSPSTGVSCPQCGQLFVSLQTMETHLESHALFQKRGSGGGVAGGPPFRCQECGRTFLISAQLRTHMHKHRGERPFPCEECGRAFFTRGDLGVHMRIHTGEKPFQCQYCPMSFRKSSGFHRHMRTLHMGMPVDKISRPRGRPAKDRSSTR